MKDEEIREVVTKREPIFKGHVLDVQKWTVRLPDGQEASREVILHRGASAIVPVDEDGCTYLVRQSRVATGEILEEIPAGKLDYEGEDRLEAAKRELKEETGFTAETWTHLTDIYTTPGFTNECISLYLAQGLKKGETDFDDDEFLDLVRIPMADALKKVYSGAMKDGKSVTGLILANAKLSGE